MSARAASSAAAFSAGDASPRVVYTRTDEAPALATFALLPVVRAFLRRAGVEVDVKDISLAARILAQFPDRLRPEQRVPDALAELGDLCKRPEANVIKLPNVSASVPQLEAAIAELQAHGYAVPNLAEARDAYARVLGSAVNPVLREGNSDRRVAPPVKSFARANPHRLGAWRKDSATHVASMQEGDFYGSEKSAVVPRAGAVRIELHDRASGEVRVLRDEVRVQAGEVIDASRMSARHLRAFYEREIEDARRKGLLLSLHLKATMMKVSDPILFGHAVDVFYRSALSKHAVALEPLELNLNNGIGEVYAKVKACEALSDDQKEEILADLRGCEASPAIAMVDSARGVTNLHVPSDVIIDASMPVLVRDSGMMWNADNKLQETKALIPDRSYAGIYAAVIDFCREHGAFDVATMGSVSNVGLMAQKAEEYGSHDKTFKVPVGGVVKVVRADSGDVIFEHIVEVGDVWRMCQTKMDPIRDWVRLAVARANATGAPAYFWLDPQRPHDENLARIVRSCLDELDTRGTDIQILSPIDAMRRTCERAKRGEDTISVTGNVLRDYLTDLFPILELGTSAKMLSVVPLLAGGGLYETGAGGSAPKHVQQFVEENHLRWDSLGEYLAIAVSLEDLGRNADNPKAGQLGVALNAAVGRLLAEKKSPSRKVREIDNRGSTFHVAKFWARELASADLALARLADTLEAKEETIMDELLSCQGSPVDIGGYYHPDPVKTEAAMRPSPTLNAAIEEVLAE